MVPFAAAADRFTPFFFAPSAGGPIGVGAGVVSAAGVAALESDALSPFEMVDTTSAFGLAGDSLVCESSLESFDSGDWDASLTDTEGKISRSSSGDTLRVTSNPCLVADLRRPSAALGGAIAS